MEKIHLTLVQMLKISLLLLFFQIFCCADAQTDQDVKDILLSIKSEFLKNNGSMGNLSTWKESDTNLCAWHGVICDVARIRPIALNMSTFGLQGEVPSQFGRLMPRLEMLDLSRNNLTGNVTELLVLGCMQLRILDLSHNNLTGSIPYGIQHCRNLQNLRLSCNSFVDDIPPRLINMCGSLKEIDIMQNKLDGPLPPLVVNCSKIEVMNFAENNFYGTIPESYRMHRNLKRLFVMNNTLSGFFPKWFGELKNLELLGLSSNWFSGDIPGNISEARKLEYLFADDNKLVGGVPSELYKLPRLKVLDLSINLLVGHIPAEICWVKSLRALLLARNRLGGWIPREIGNLTELQILDLAHNRLSGEIPHSIGQLQNLLWLSLTSNFLFGAFPAEISNCSSLTWLKAENNDFTGDLPCDLWRMGKNANATFALNAKTEVIFPPGISQCKAFLRWMPVMLPGLTSNINPTRCTVFWNAIVIGKFPITYCRSVGNNVPAYIQLSGNKLTGPIPRSMGNSTNLSFVYLGSNNFTDTIPETLAELPLTVLNVSRNQLIGHIPTQLGNAVCLVEMDLSYNMLSGIIPPSLQNLTALARFNISYNSKLRGPVPTGGQFTTFSADSYMGDSDLCLDVLHAGRDQEIGKGNYTISFCSKKTPPGQSPSKNEKYKNEKKGGSIDIIVSVVAVALVLEVLCVVAVLKVCKKRTNWKEFIYPRSPSGISFKDLEEATDNFSEARIIGQGGFGVVYKGDLQIPDIGTLKVAVKRLITSSPRTEREFAAETETLSDLSHPNLVPLLAVCVHGNEKFLVYRFMANGCLDRALHEDKALAKKKLGDFHVRARIALGAARALRFLHEECAPAVVHRDVKSSNVLLDEDLEAVLTDFGLARMMASDENHVTTMLAGTPGYVPPEYGKCWQATPHGDVYSFGVVMLELVTGRRPIEEGLLESCGLCTVDWARRSFEDGRDENILDPLLKERWFGRDHGRRSLVMDFIRVAYDCTQDEPCLRPTMTRVVHLLQSICDGFT